MAVGYLLPVDNKECLALNGMLNVRAIMVEYIDHGQSMVICKKDGIILKLLIKTYVFNLIQLSVNPSTVLYISV